VDCREQRSQQIESVNRRESMSGLASETVVTQSDSLASTSRARSRLSS
jgi:hypothetical protein